MLSRFIILYFIKGQNLRKDIILNALSKLQAINKSKIKYNLWRKPAYSEFIPNSVYTLSPGSFKTFEGHNSVDKWALMAEHDYIYVLTMKIMISKV